MKIKRWMILTTVFVVLASSIIVSGCQTSPTASTNKEDIVHEELCSNMCYDMCDDCSVAGKSYNCNTPEGRSDYFDACISNYDYNGKTYNCKTLGGCISFWGTCACDIACDMCMQVCEGADSENSNAND